MNEPLPSAPEARTGASRADVCLVLEGTYPYVAGGVSSWVHELIKALPGHQFSLVHIGPERGSYPKKHYALPANVASLSDLYCREPLPEPKAAPIHQRAGRAARRRYAAAGRGSRVLGALRQLHLADELKPELLAEFSAGDLSVPAFLHGDASFGLAEELCERLAPEASFLDFFWHFRSMHLPLVRLLAAPVPTARTYHALCTGYAGLLGAVWSHRTGRRFLLTEHGIYSRERTLELSRAAWVPRRDEPVDERTTAPLQRMWDRFFKSLARCAYSQAWRVVTLSDVNRQRQLADGATPAQTRVIPNGIDVEGLERRLSGAGDLLRRPGPARVGFVGRLVPIKDVGTFIRACAVALKTVELEVHIIGPLEEDPAYARRCQKLVEALGLSTKVFFDGPQPLERIYRQLDMVVLTSLSEGQPLVLLEAGAAGIPVIATNVGACRELIYGRDEPDRRIGASGIVTRLASPDETAAAIVRLARDPALRRRLGTAGRTRVRTFYRQRDTVDRYRALYREGGGLWLASGGASNA